MGRAFVFVSALWRVSASYGRHTPYSISPDWSRAGKERRTRCTACFPPGGKGPFPAGGLKAAPPHGTSGRAGSGKCSGHRRTRPPRQAPYTGHCRSCSTHAPAASPCGTAGSPWPGFAHAACFPYLTLQRHKGGCPSLKRKTGSGAFAPAGAGGVGGTGIFTVMVIVMVINCCVIIPVPPSFWPVQFPSWPTAPLSFSGSPPP